ncbi:MAG TPA: ArsC family (seleno)protein [Myxococcota bacterium]|nr:ArsC family (seleno)protein [Myxococcota bacterium]
MSCTRASKFLDANGIEAREVVLASRKLGRNHAAELAAQASEVIVAKGTQLRSFKPAGKPSRELLDAMLGPTGNLRAPAIRKGRLVLVGFNAELFAEKLG